MVAVIGKDQSHIRRTTCYKCSSVLEYTLSEVQQDYSTDYTGCKDYYKYIYCPCCGNKAIVKGY